MTAGNRQRKGVGYSGTTPESYCNLEEGDSDFPLFAMIPWKVTVLIFKLFEQLHSLMLALIPMAVAIVGRETN